MDAMSLTLSHDLVDFAVLLAANKFLMLVGQLDLDTHLIGRTLDEWNLINDHHSCLDSIIGTVDGERKFLKANIGTRVCTDVGQHSSNVGRRGSTHPGSLWVIRQ